MRNCRGMKMRIEIIALYLFIIFENYLACTVCVKKIVPVSKKLSFFLANETRVD